MNYKTYPAQDITIEQFVDRKIAGQIKYTQEIIRERKQRALVLCKELVKMNDELKYFQDRLWSLTHGN